MKRRLEQPERAAGVNPSKKRKLEQPERAAKGVKQGKKARKDKAAEQKGKKKLPPWVRRMMIPEKKCPDCRGGGAIIDDPKSGRRICTSCGLVLEHSIISEQSEWRTFADNDRGGPDPNRVGAAQHYLLSEMGDLSTSIGTGADNKLANAQKAIGGNLGQSKLSRGIRDISNYCSRLGLPKDVENFSGELFKELTSKKEMKGKRALVMVATCVYIAAKQCHCDRPLKELCEEFGVDRTSVRKIHTEIHKLKSANKLTLPVVNKGQGMIRKTTAEIFAQRYAGQLKLHANTIKHMKKIARKIMDRGLLSGKQPATIGAACVYFACLVGKDDGERRSYKEISAVSRVSEHTIANAFKKHLFLVRKQLIPEGFADPVRVENLSAK